MRPTCSGSSKLFYYALLPNGFPGKVMKFILTSWNDFTVPKDKTNETEITSLFRDKMLKDNNNKNIAFISLEDPIIDQYGHQVGRNDLRFYPIFHGKQRIFFTVECKRLYTKNGSLITEYIKEGMMRFVTNRYANEQDCGGMVGYVIDGNTIKAFERLKEKVNEEKIPLALKNNISSPSGLIPHYNCSADTMHERKNSLFRIHHALLAVKYDT